MVGARCRINPAVIAAGLGLVRTRERNYSAEHTYYVSMGSYSGGGEYSLCAQLMRLHVARLRGSVATSVVATVNLRLPIAARHAVMFAEDT